MNKYLKYFSGTLVGLMLSTSAFAAAEYAVVLKTLSNPFWVDMKKGIEDEAKTLGVSVDIFASPSEGDFQSQLQLFEDLSNKNYKGVDSICQCNTPFNYLFRCFELQCLSRSVV